MFDTHIHLGSMSIMTVGKLVSSREKRFLTCGYDRESSLSSVKISKESENVYCAAGLHPGYIADESFTDELEKLVSVSGKIIAVGEAGLDAGYPEPQLQRDVFEKQIIIAERTGLPLIVHNVRATDEILSMIGKHPDVRYIMHGYTGSSETADKLLSYDVYFGIGRTVTYRNPRRLLEALRVIPAERILLETDDPYMDETTALNNLESVLHSLAVILDTDEEKLEYVTDRNAEEAFGL